jgi:hypothetical protein
LSRGKTGFLSSFRRPRAPRKLGFFATRSVTAASEKDAEILAVERVKAELYGGWNVENESTDPPRFLVSEVRPLLDAADPALTASGFTFYAHDERH